MNPAKSMVSVAIVVAFSFSGCKSQKGTSGFLLARVDRQITGQSKFPIAVDVGRVGTYPSETKSGAGYFYDDVLEYRVWLNPKRGAQPLNGSSDYYVAFAQFEPAQAFSEKSSGAEAPLVLVRQREWINEPKPRNFVPEKGERVTEWQVQWLAGHKRDATSIEQFLKHPYEAGPNE